MRHFNLTHRIVAGLVSALLAVSALLVPSTSTLVAAAAEWSNLEGTITIHEEVHKVFPSGATFDMTNDVTYRVSLAPTGDPPRYGRELRWSQAHPPFQQTYTYRESDPDACGTLTTTKERSASGTVGFQSDTEPPIPASIDFWVHHEADGPPTGYFLINDGLVDGYQKVVVFESGGEECGPSYTERSTVPSELIFYVEVDTGGYGGGILPLGAPNGEYVETGSDARYTVDFSLTRRGVNGIDWFTVRVTADLSALQVTSPDLDAPPAPSVPNSALVTGKAITSGSLPVTFTWAGKAGSAPIASYDVETRVDSGAWSLPASQTAANKTVNCPVPNHSCQVRVQTVDTVGRHSPWATSKSASPVAYQQTSSTRYRGTWSTVRSSAFSGGTAKKATAAGASVTFTFTGRSVAWVGLKCSRCGSVKVYINGKYVTTVSTYASTTAYKRFTWTKTWSTSATRTLKLVVTGTAGHPRVYVDLFAKLK